MSPNLAKRAAGALAACLVSLSRLHAAGESATNATNTVALAKPPDLPPEPEIRPHLPVTNPRSFWSIYSNELETRGNGSSFRHLYGPAPTVSMLHQIDRKGYDFHQSMNDRGKNLVADALTDALRESIVESMPLEEWKAYWDHRGRSYAHATANFLITLFEGSVGNTEQQRVEAVASVPLYEQSDMEQAWREKNERTGVLKYGMRDPTSYYFTVAFGHLVDDKPAFLDTRLHLVTDINRLERVRVQQRLSIPVIDSVRLVFGVSAYPADLERNGDVAESVRLERVVKGCITYVGAVMRQDGRQNETRVEGGVFLPFSIVFKKR